AVARRRPRRARRRTGRARGRRSGDRGDRRARRGRGPDPARAVQPPGVLGGGLHGDDPRFRRVRGRGMSTVTQPRVVLSEWTKLRSLRATRFSLLVSFCLVIVFCLLIPLISLSN